MAATINVLVKTFAGIEPSTIALPLASSTPISSLFDSLSARLPAIDHKLYLSTISGRFLQPSSSDPLSTLSGDDFLNLRLHAPLCGGKGGFGSQLRAAGGRMSSRKRKGQENNDSCRNLDGRRMRTVKEAKALAAYLEIRPEMEAKEKKERRERWEKVVESTEDKIKGGGKSGQARFDDNEWLEQKEETRDRTREAVLKAMKMSGGKVPVRPLMAGSSSSGSSEEVSAGEEDGAGVATKSSTPEEEMKPAKSSAPRYFGFDDEDEAFLSSDGEHEEAQSPVVGKGKGKGKARR